MQEVLFASTVGKLTDNDFTLNETAKLNLKNTKMCCMILFHDRSPVSMYMADIWNKISSQVAGGIFYSCDLISNKQVAITIRNPSENPSQEWINLSKIPLILIYSKGIPKGVYNGIYQEIPLLQYASSLNCDSGILEKSVNPNIFTG